MEPESSSGGTEPALGGVVVDIGDGIGALLVYTPAELSGAEIEVSPADGGRRTHTIVRPRRLPQKIAYAAVFPRLAAGQYTLLGLGAIESAPVTITGGSVTELTW